MCENPKIWKQRLLGRDNHNDLTEVSEAGEIGLIWTFEKATYLTEIFGWSRKQCDRKNKYWYGKIKLMRSKNAINFGASKPIDWSKWATLGPPLPPGSAPRNTITGADSRIWSRGGPRCWGRNFCRRSEVRVTRAKRAICGCRPGPA